MQRSQCTTSKEKARKLETFTAASSSHHEEPPPAEEPRASDGGDDEPAPNSEVASEENQETFRQRELRRRRRKQKQKDEKEEEDNEERASRRRKKGKQMSTDGKEEVPQCRVKAREMMALKIGVENPAWAVQKTLFVSDISNHQHRLQLPRSGLEASPLLDMITPAEAKEMHGKGAKIVVLDGLRNEYSMLFRDVGNNNGFRILGADWMNYVRRNKLEAGDSLDLWAFRRPHKDAEKTELVFVLLHHQNKNQTASSKKKAKKVSSSSSSSVSSSSSSNSPRSDQSSSEVTRQDRKDAEEAELVFALLHQLIQNQTEESEKKAKQVSSSSAAASSNAPPAVQSSWEVTRQDELDADRGLLKFYTECLNIQKKRKSQSTDGK